MSVRDHACDDARARASRELDGGLEELDRLMLERHLGTCPACAQFAAVTALVTNELRRAPLEPFRCGPVIRRKRPLARAPLVSSVAAVALVTAVGLGVVAYESDRGHDKTRLQTVPLRTKPDPAAPSQPDNAFVGSQRITLPIGQKSASEDFST